MVKAESNKKSRGRQRMRDLFIRASRKMLAEQKERGKEIL